MRAARPRRASWVVATAWGLLLLAVMGPVAIAAASPLQAFRGASYVAASLAGVLALGLLLVQPLLAAGYLPGAGTPRMRRWHHRVGAALVAAVAVHVGGLYVASPPDALDALLLVSPTPFSVWGVTAMWAVILTALLVALRRRLRLRPAAWRVAHNALALVVVVGTVIHALQIEGTMGAASKWVLCGAALAASVAAIVHLRVVRPLMKGH